MISVRSYGMKEVAKTIPMKDISCMYNISKLVVSVNDSCFFGAVIENDNSIWRIVEARIGIVVEEGVG